MRSPFSKDIFIRLSGDDELVCTTQVGWLPRKVTAVPLTGPTEEESESNLAARREARRHGSVLGLSDSL